MPNRVPPPREFNWARTLRTLSFWALLIVGSIALVQFASSRRQEAVEISYTQFTEQLDGGNVAAVEITERQQIKGDFKHAVAVGRRSAEHFTTLLPFEARSEWVQTLQQKGDRKSTRLNSSHSQISYAVFCLKKKESPSSLDSHIPSS